MIKEFTHPELGKEVQALAGFYTPIEQNVMQYNERQVLYITGSICIDSSCCGGGNWNYIQVPGFLIKENIQNAEDSPITSEIDTIQDERERNDIRRLLSGKYPGARIEFE